MPNEESYSKEKVLSLEQMTFIIRRSLKRLPNEELKAMLESDFLSGNYRRIIHRLLKNRNRNRIEVI